MLRKQYLFDRVKFDTQLALTSCSTHYYREIPCKLCPSSSKANYMCTLKILASTLVFDNGKPELM